MNEKTEKNLKKEPPAGLQEYVEVRERVYEAINSTPSRLSHISSADISAAAETTSTTALFPPMNKNTPESVFDFGAIEESLQFEQPNISTFDVSRQDSLLVQDLLYVLSGARGSYITPVDPTKTEIDCDIWGPTFTISEDVHPSLRDLMAQVLPLATHYTAVNNFQHKATFSNCGQVLQAFGAALHEVVCDYQRLISQMESLMDEGELTLETMRHCVRPTLNVMQMLANVIRSVVTNKCRGGRVLTLLVETVNELAGDEESQKILIELTELAAVPYMKSLEIWLNKGVIYDPQGEFFVEENAQIRHEECPKTYAFDYWSKRYTVKTQHIPCFLEKFADVVLRSGKYMNVIRLCGNKPTPAEVVPLKYSYENKSYEKAIQDVYRFASKHLLDVVTKEHDLMGQLTSVRRYFLFHQGDFITQFMDACEGELNTILTEVRSSTFQNCLDFAQELTLAKHDPHRNNIGCELLSRHLLTQLYKIDGRDDCGMDVLRGWDCLVFVYESKWPVCLVLNHMAISKYQMLFRRLFGFKHVNRQLYKCWHEKLLSKNRPLHEAKMYDAAIDLYRRMKNAIRCLEYHMLIEVIGPQWQIFVKKAEEAQNLDEILSSQDGFLECCLRSSLLTVDTEINRFLCEMIETCWKFSQFIQAESLATTAELHHGVNQFNREFSELFSGFFQEISSLAVKNPSNTFSVLVYSLKQLNIVKH